MIFKFEVDKLLIKQLQEVETWHRFLPEFDFSSVEDFPKLVSTQHQVNFELWHQEDLARDPDALDSIISNVKRVIDVLNQRRNDLIEQMDQFLLNIINAENVEINAETKTDLSTVSCDASASAPLGIAGAFG